MLKFLNLSLRLVIFPGMLFLLSCEIERDKYYEVSGLKGDAQEILEDRGNYSLFLEAVQKAGYERVIAGKGIYTVMAPNDEAFSAYLSSKGYGSVNDIPTMELAILVGYHFVENPYNKDLFSNYLPDGRDSYNAEEQGLYYKHQTLATRPVSQTQTALIEGNLQGTVRNINVFHKNLYLPVLSENLFNTKEINAEYNYEYFYPSSEWTGQNDGFNVSDASVLEYEIPSDNGFVYLIDRVIEPLETVHRSLQNKGEYSNFLTLYDRFSIYVYDEAATENYGNGDSLFIHQHDPLPTIASEWPYNGEGALADYQDVKSLKRDAFSVYVPNNSALEDFFQQTWAPYYSSLSEVNLLQVIFLLNNHVFDGSVVFPEEISKGEALTAFDTPVQFDPDGEVSDKQICTNGVYYGLNSVQTPPMFNSITGPLFRDPQFSMFLQMLASSGSAQALSSEAINYTIFIPSDENVLSAGYYDLNIQYKDLRPEVFGDESIQIQDGTFVDMSTSQMSGYVDSHVATEVIAEVSGVQVYKTRNNFDYLYVKSDSIASNKMYNWNREYRAISRIDGDWTNGQCFTVDTVLLKENLTFKFELESVVSGATPNLQEYTEFAQLLSQAGFALNPPLDFILDNYMVFIPTNEAVQNAIAAGDIPTDSEELAEYLKYYFVPVDDNDLSDYLFPGGGISDNFITFETREETVEVNGVQRVVDVPREITITDQGTSLLLTTPGGQTATSRTLPRVYDDGAVYLIDNVFTQE